MLKNITDWLGIRLSLVTRLKLAMFSFIPTGTQSINPTFEFTVSVATLPYSISRLYIGLADHIQYTVSQELKSSAFHYVVRNINTMYRYCNFGIKWNSPALTISDRWNLSNSTTYTSQQRNSTVLVSLHVISSSSKPPTSLTPTTHTPSYDGTKEKSTHHSSPDFPTHSSSFHYQTVACHYSTPARPRLPAAVRHTRLRTMRR